MATEVALALELRVLTGLQSSAALPLEEPLLVGSGEEADLLLLDEGIAQAQSRLSLGADGDIRLEVLANDVVLQDGRRLASGDSLTLLPGQPFQIGPAWLMVQPDDAPWAPWTPPLPQARSSEPTVSGDMQAEERDEPSLPDETAAVKPGETAPSARRRRTGASGRKNAAPRRRLALPAGRVRVIGSLIVAAGLLSTMLGVAALVRQASGAERSDGAAATAPAESPASAPTPTPTPISDSASDAGSSPVPPPMSTPTASDDSPEPIGKGLVVQIPGEDDVVLPFDIAEVLMGLSSHVILSDGRRLHPGDRVGPWRLVAIQRGVLVFDGPRKVQVAW